MRQDKNPRFLWDNERPYSFASIQLYRLDDPEARWTKNLASVSEMARVRKLNIHVGYFSFEEMAAMKASGYFQ